LSILFLNAMDLLQRIIEYIDENIIDIEFPEHRLHEKFGVSDSKLQKDFRNGQNITLRQFLIDRKMKLAQKMIFDHPLLTREEIMVKINFDLTERSFRNHFREFEKSQETHDYEESSGLSPNHFRNNTAFAEIYLRLALFLKQVEVNKNEIKANSINIYHDVRDTIFNIGIPLSIEDSHNYCLFLNPISMEIDCMFFPSSGEMGCSFNSIAPHIGYLNKLERHFKEHLSFSITDAVIDFHRFDKNIYRSSNEDIIPSLVKIKGDPLICIDRDSKFIKETDYILDRIKTLLKINSEICIQKNYGTHLGNIDLYIKAVDSGSIEMMWKLLASENLSNIYTLSLLLDLTVCPYFEGDILHESRLFFDETILNEITLQSKTSIIDLIIRFYWKMKEVDENEDWDEPERDDILKDLFYSI
jgi:AraC-like DNA-binding protein